MVAEKEELLETLNVVKRNGKKVSFDGSKIAIAIKKGFDSVVAEDENGEHIKKYNEKDIQKVYHSIIKRIEKENEENGRIKIETIQDMIESELQKKGYEDVYKNFSEDVINQDNFSLMRKKHISF